MLLFLKSGDGIEHAIVGIRNYDSGNPNINATAGGAITVDFTTMRDNITPLAVGPYIATI